MKYKNHKKHRARLLTAVFAAVMVMSLMSITVSARENGNTVLDEDYFQYLSEHDGAFLADCGFYYPPKDDFENMRYSMRMPSCARLRKCIWTKTTWSAPKIIDFKFSYENQ